MFSILTKKHLKNTFRKARETKSPCVFVAITAEGAHEVVVIPEKFFDVKEKFYEKAYTDDLTHVMNKSVFIRGLSYGGIDELGRLI